MIVSSLTEFFLPAAEIYKSIRRARIGGVESLFGWGALGATIDFPAIFSLPGAKGEGSRNALTEP
jgi:hypothetical protein